MGQGCSGVQRPAKRELHREACAGGGGEHVGCSRVFACTVAGGEEAEMVQGRCWGGRRRGEGGRVGARQWAVGSGERGEGSHTAAHGARDWRQGGGGNEAPIPEINTILAVVLKCACFQARLAMLSAVTRFRERR